MVVLIVTTPDADNVVAATDPETLPAEPPTDNEDAVPVNPVPGPVNWVLAVIVVPPMVVNVPAAGFTPPMTIPLMVPPVNVPIAPVVLMLNGKLFPLPSCTVTREEVNPPGICSRYP